MIELFGANIDDQPYRWSQYLAVRGIHYLYQRLVEQQELLSDVLESIGTT